MQAKTEAELYDEYREAHDLKGVPDEVIESIYGFACFRLACRMFELRECLTEEGKVLLDKVKIPLIWGNKDNNAGR